MSHSSTRGAVTPASAIKRAICTKGSLFSLSGGASITMRVPPGSAVSIRKYRRKLASAEASRTVAGSRRCAAAMPASHCWKAAARSGSAQTMGSAEGVGPEAGSGGAVMDNRFYKSAWRGNSCGPPRSNRVAAGSCNLPACRAVLPTILRS
ncbi:hypothetical protein ABID97_000509 [Variovorax sp. OAS795]